MARVLITGMSGFTGHFLRQRLENDGYEVVGLSTNQHNPSQGIYQANLLDLEGLQGIIKIVRPDYVFHLAAIAFVAHGSTDEIYQTNLIGSQHLLKALSSLANLPKHIILASSANTYGNATVEPITENTPFHPANDYAVSKVAMEYMAQTWTDKLPISIVRPFNYTGAGQADNFLIPKIVKHFKQKAAVVELGNLDVVRDFSDVRDVVDAYARLLPLAACGEAYNVCSGIGTSLTQIIDMMQQISGHTIEVEVNPAFVRANEVKRLVGSDAKLIKQIGDRKLHTLAQTLEWMYKN